MDICVTVYEKWTKELDLNKLLDPDWEAKWNASQAAAASGANVTSTMTINFTEHFVNVSYARTAPSCASHAVSVTIVPDHEPGFNGYNPSSSTINNGHHGFI